MYCTYNVDCLQSPLADMSFGEQRHPFRRLCGAGSTDHELLGKVILLLLFRHDLMYVWGLCEGDYNQGGNNDRSNCLTGEMSSNICRLLPHRGPLQDDLPIDLTKPGEGGVPRHFCANGSNMACCRLSVLRVLSAVTKVVAYFLRT